MRIRHSISSMGVSLAALTLFVATSFAAPLSTPTISAVSFGHAKARFTINAGVTGAPNGFEVCYMPAALYAQYGGWPATGWWPEEGWVTYTGVGTLNTWGTQEVNFRLAPGQSIDVEIGDAEDETGVAGTLGELDDAEDWVVCVFAVGGGGSQRSPYSPNLLGSTTPQGEDCTFTIGYWKNHPEVWPVGSLTLGTVNYTSVQLMAILNQPVGGNGLISLAHQLIAAKLNIANGASDATIIATINAADAQIGGLVVPPVGAGNLAPGSTSTKTQALDDFNNGLTGPGHCGSTPTRSSTWGSVKTSIR